MCKLNLRSQDQEDSQTLFEASLTNSFQTGQDSWYT